MVPESFKCTLIFHGLHGLAVNFHKKSITEILAHIFELS